ncbi:hypothetical protein ABZ816_05775 [Actinosynnema sp. NPDC047251]|uniref:Uncharacterized protein n=1 Tax=Saccharothrix espanaensis (strain ATCC 51144 / DSM 44229 / JCM 9112 / NBRC 15066 / NRRL 15764) TaxID=1179773 RepID=K0JV15_SACES|nr:hypothetical protein [Saccharothrix espanaensis]CCH28038.1 hypothetical protein BN6_07100 [Saccharothrix espanaensis DSM 44229]
MGQRVWTDDLIKALRDSGLAVDEDAAEALGTIIDRGRATLARDAVAGGGAVGGRQVAEFDHPDFGGYVEVLHERLVEVASEHKLDVLTKDTTQKVWGWLCPGFYPWC